MSCFLASGTVLVLGIKRMLFYDEVAQGKLCLLNGWVIDGWIDVASLA